MAFPSDLVRTKDWTTEILTDTDLEGQFDIIVNWLMASMDAATGHDHSGASNKSQKIDLAGATIGVTGTLALGNGGTGQTTLAGLMNLVYPVGSLYFNAIDSTNPGTLLGFGTWVAFGAGKIPIGIDSGDSDFDTLEETGGSKTADISHTHGAGTYYHPTNAGGAGGGPDLYGNTVQNIGLQGTSASGGSSSLSIMNPYIVVSIWKRTA